MLSSLAHIFWLRESLETQFPDRAFVIITPFSDGECTVRFHPSRNNERWLADDLDKYESEAILEITLRSAKLESGRIPLGFVSEPRDFQQALKSPQEVSKAAFFPPGLKAPPILFSPRRSNGSHHAAMKSDTAPIEISATKTLGRYPNPTLLIA